MAAYVKNKDLLNELALCREQDEASTILVNMFYKISTHYAHKYIYKQSEDKSDIIQGGVVDAYRYWRSFNPKKSTNAFAYITQVIKNGQLKAFRQLHPNARIAHISLSSNKIYSF